MSSVWVIGLGLAAGYLINKNLAIQGQLESSVAEYQSAAKPATGGVTSEEVRNAWKRTDYVKYGDMNTDLSRSEMDKLVKMESTAASEVEMYDSSGAPARIEGVLMHFDGLGV